RPGLPKPNIKGDGDGKGRGQGRGSGGRGGTGGDNNIIQSFQSSGDGKGRDRPNRRERSKVPASEEEGEFWTRSPWGDMTRARKTKNESESTPQTWHRDGRRPTFARVYIGDGNSLELVSLQVTVTIEGPRARTVVDHIFRNPHDRQLEGTFEYPLPTGASASYFAMFIGQTRDTVP